jgi:hypothetical protein
VNDNGPPRRIIKLETRQPDDLPAVTPVRFIRLGLIDPAGRLNRSSKNPPAPDRGVEEQHAGGFSAGVFEACGTPRAGKAQAPGPPTVNSSAILKVISPLSTLATSSLWRWSRPGLVDIFSLEKEVPSMPKSHQPYAPEFRRQMVDLVRPPPLVRTSGRPRRHNHPHQQ